MPTIWSVRAFRLWFFFAAPATAVLAGWLVTATADRIQTMQELRTLASAVAKSQLNQINPYSAIIELEEEERRSKLDPAAYVAGSPGSLRLAQLNEKVEFARRLRDEQEAPLRGPERALSRSFNEAGDALVRLLAVLVVPIVIIGARKVVAWIWYRPTATAATSVQAPSSDSSLLAKYTRWYLWIAGGLSTSALMLFFFPEPALKTLVSGVVQAIVVAIGAWGSMQIYRMFRRNDASQETPSK